MRQFSIPHALQTQNASLFFVYNANDNAWNNQIFGEYPYHKNNLGRYVTLEH